MSRCKVCEATAEPFAEVDFAKSCADGAGAVFPRDGRAVRYDRCVGCGLVFTRFFDAYTPDDFRREVYNDAYLLADPLYPALRPARNAAFLRAVLREACDSPGAPSLLDYGAGAALLTAALGPLAAVRTWDPFSGAAASSPPDGVFDVVFASEVLEHVTRPRDTLRALRDLLAPGGFVLFSTALTPPDLDALGGSWWYLAPRNGHVTLYTAEALAAGCAQAGLGYTRLSAEWHLAQHRDAPCATLDLSALQRLVDGLPVGFVEMADV